MLFNVYRLQTFCNDELVIIVVVVVVVFKIAEVTKLFAVIRNYTLISKMGQTVIHQIKQNTK